MLILLPPSETKRDGGADGRVLVPARLSFPELAAARRSVAAELRALARNLKTMATALKLSTGQHHELLRNRVFGTAPTMPAMDRYTGVLYDAFAAETLPAEAREFAADHLVIHSALFGLLGAGDLIPPYRLSHDSRLPTRPLKKHWRAPIATVLEGYEGLILDLRSESYVALGPAPLRAGSWFLRVVAEGSDGKKRALNHFNKKGKGEFARAIVVAGVDHPDAESLLRWAADAGFTLGYGAAGELELVVANTLG